MDCSVEIDTSSNLVSGKIICNRWRHFWNTYTQPSVRFSTHNTLVTHRTNNQPACEVTQSVTHQLNNKPVCKVTQSVTYMALPTQWAAVTALVVLMREAPQEWDPLTRSDNWWRWLAMFVLAPFTTFWLISSHQAVENKMEMWWTNRKQEGDTWTNRK